MEPHEVDEASFQESQFGIILIDSYGSLMKLLLHMEELTHNEEARRRPSQREGLLQCQGFILVTMIRIQCFAQKGQHGNTSQASARLHASNVLSSYARPSPDSEYGSNAFQHCTL